MKKFTLYIGLYDKESKRQEITTLDAYKITANIFRSTTGGVTITEAVGVYTYDNGDTIIEPSLRCEIFGATAEQIKTALNQKSIALEETEVNSKFI